MSRYKGRLNAPGATRSTERSRALTAYHVPAATAGRTAASLVPTLARSSLSRRPVLFSAKRRVPEQPSPFSEVRSVRRKPMDWMLAAVVVLLLLGSLMSAHGPDIGGRRHGS